MNMILADLKKTCVLLAVLMAWASGGVADAQKAEEVRTVVVIGSAPVQGSQVTAARDAAIANSLMNAVALTAIESLSPEGFSENFKTLNQQLLDKPDDYIQDFRVLSETVIAKQHRVVVQATVKARAIRERMADAGLVGGKSAVVSASPMALTVEGSGNLTNFVKFRKALGGIPGVESIQVRDMKPNETTLVVTYKGVSKDLATVLAQLSFDTFAVSVVEAGEGALRAVMSAK